MIGLVRVSTAEQGAEGRGGLERQRDIIRKTVASKNLHLVEQRELIDVSGTVTGSHPVMRDLLAKIADGSVKGIVVADLDRLFRPDRPESYAVLQVFQDMGAKIFSGDTEYDLRTKEGMLFTSVRSAISGFEIGLMKERQHGAKEVKRKDGKCPTNKLTLPLGVTYDHRMERWGLSPDIAKVVELFRLFDEEGIRNFSELGRRIGVCGATARNLLRNRLYTGWRVIDQKRGTKLISASGKAYRQKIARARDEVIAVKVMEPVISDECFARVQAALEEIKFNHVEQRGRSQVNITAGIAVCAHCGHPIFCISGRRGAGGNRRSYYQCKANHYAYKKRLSGCALPNIRHEDLDDAILALARRVLATPKFLERLVERGLEMRERKVAAFPMVTTAESQSQELSRREQRLLTAYEEGVLSLEELRAKRDTLARQRVLLRKLEQGMSADDNSTNAVAMSRRILKGALRFQKCGDRTHQKKVVHELFAEVHVRDCFITGVRFRSGTNASKLNGDAQTLVLPEPVLIGASPLPAGKRQCLKCTEMLPESEFYRRLNTCNACRKRGERERHLRRRARAIMSACQQPKLHS